ncbi:transmembrane amino acid transporter protein-domain-containing protein [Mycena rebaudengoi]|nr:transmembrane amino acid transporter protein-domain-containing protein [Mycena rebaudengoi]
MQQANIDAESVSKRPGDVILGQIEKEIGHKIRYRTCSWQKTACLLFSEYVCLAILAFPWSYSILGLVPGILVTLGVAASVQYTSLIVWKFCMKYPEVRNACDIGRIIFGGSQWGYNATAMGFVLNNTFIQALECLVGAKLLNTLSHSDFCTVGFSAIVAAFCFILSLPRTLNEMGFLATISAVTMGISVLLAVVFSAIQNEPFGYLPGEPSVVITFPVVGTTFISGKELDIYFKFVCYFHFILQFLAEMKEPRDFPKALWVATIGEVTLFILCGSIMYHYIGNQYITSPAFGSLQPVFKKIAFCFAIPSILYLGALYSSVTARFIFFHIFPDSEHTRSNTLVGWSAWAGIIAVTWILAFLLAELIPFFSDMLSTICALFNGWFGFIYWAMAYLTLYPGKAKWSGPWRTIETLFNYFLIAFGLFILIAGTYVSVQSIINSYHASLVGSVFSCASNAV